MHPWPYRANWGVRRQGAAGTEGAGTLWGTRFSAVGNKQIVATGSLLQQKVWLDTSVEVATTDKKTIFVWIHRKDYLEGILYSFKKCSGTATVQNNLNAQHLKM